MKLWRIVAPLLLLACVRSLAETPTLNLSATWNWPPRSYYDSPDRAGGTSLWRQLQYAGILTPIDERDGFRPYFPYGYYGHDLMWGYDYRVQLKMHDALYFPDVHTPAPFFLPGAAPLEPRDAQREDSWDLAIANFLTGLDTSAWTHNQTNAHPLKETRNAVAPDDNKAQKQGESGITR